MALVLTEDQQMLRESAKDFLADTAPVDEFRALRDAGETFDRELWQQMVELGWSSIVVPDTYDGVDFGITGLGLIAIEAGRNLVASPLLTTAAIGASALLLGNSEHDMNAIIVDLGFSLYPEADQVTVRRFASRCVQRQQQQHSRYKACRQLRCNVTHQCAPTVRAPGQRAGHRYSPAPPQFVSTRPIYPPRRAARVSGVRAWWSPGG